MITSESLSELTRDNISKDFLSRQSRFSTQTHSVRKRFKLEEGIDKILFSAYASLSPIGSWYIPFNSAVGVQSNISKYVACDGVHQRAVTHTDANSHQVNVLHLQWTPPYNYHGIVVITATVVVNYTTYWTNIRSHPVTVSLGEKTDSSHNKVSSTTSTTSTQVQTTSDPEHIIDLYHEFISLENNDQATHQESSSQQNRIPVENLYNIVTESINVSNHSFPKERSPRFENQELYERMEASYGSWENGVVAMPANYKMIIALTTLSCVHIINQARVKY